MQLRHVRAVAVCALVIVALTGARGSRGGGGGGGCDDDNSTSSSGSYSSSGGSHSGGGSYDGSGSSSSGGSGVSGVTSGSSGGSSSGSGSNRSVLRDITIDTCGFDTSGKNLTATLRIDNRKGSMDYEYDVTVVFKETSGTTAGTARVDDFSVPAGQTGKTAVSTPYTGTGDGLEITKCQVKRADRSSF